MAADRSESSPEGLDTPEEEEEEEEESWAGSPSGGAHLPPGSTRSCCGTGPSTASSRRSRPARPTRTRCGRCTRRPAAWRWGQRSEPGRVGTGPRQQVPGCCGHQEAPSEERDAAGQRRAGATYLCWSARGRPSGWGRGSVDTYCRSDGRNTRTSPSAQAQKTKSSLATRQLAEAAWRPHGSQGCQTPAGSRAQAAVHRQPCTGSRAQAAVHAPTHLEVDPGLQLPAAVEQTQETRAGDAEGAGGRAAAATRYPAEHAVSVVS